MKSIAEEQEGGEKKRHAADRANIVRKAIDIIERKLGTEDMKATVSDLIRLLQIDKELDQEEQPREIKVTWVNPSDTTHSGE